MNFNDAVQKIKDVKGGSPERIQEFNSTLNAMRREQDELNAEIQRTLNPTSDESNKSNLWDDISTDVELAKARVNEIETEKADLKSCFNELVYEDLQPKSGNTARRRF